MKRRTRQRNRIKHGGPNHGQKPVLHRKRLKLKTGVKK